MKLVVKREPFTAALTTAAAVCPLRGMRPNLKNALLIAEADGSLEIQATDLEVGLRYRLKAESVSEPASICLPSTMLSGLLKECTEEIVTLETEGAKGVLKAGRDRFEILGQESSEFPDVPDLGDEPALQIPAVSFVQMIDQSLFAAAREQGRYAINGIYIISKDGQLELVATDGRRLAFSKMKLKSKVDMEKGVIVPLKMMQEVRKLCDQVPEKDKIDLAVRGRSILVRGGDVTLSSVLVEGIFPKYQQVIPKDAKQELKFKKEAMQQALRKAAFLTSEDTRIVDLTFSSGTCLIEARSPDKGLAAVTLEVEYTGEETKVAFNPQYLQDCLKVISSEMICMQMNDPSKPVMVKEGSNYIYVLMPVTEKKV